jgi:hypothetical protein
MRHTRTGRRARATCLYFRTVSTVTAGLERVARQTCGHAAAGRTPKKWQWAVWDGRPIRIG